MKKIENLCESRSWERICIIVFAYAFIYNFFITDFPFFHGKHIKFVNVLHISWTNKKFGNFSRKFLKTYIGQFENEKPLHKIRLG